MTVRPTIYDMFQQVAREQNKPLAPLNDNLVLLDSGLDSLCFAVITARLDNVLGFDPFSTAEDIEFPVTLGDFVRFYDNAAA